MTENENETADNDPERGEAQQPQYLIEAAKEIENAAQCHNAGMMDPAYSSATTAEALLEDYRNGPILTRDGASDLEGDQQMGDTGNRGDQ